ncbi:hypothetical protein NP233_g3166 [Leucocoprinus birnbaumii]|uniref:non-specific serine/threonine protein kinase n=1 Tax=Leucocoprinus birnbaumii TaxID=56174 RepID=A0AAD5YYJ1_9AGAR|nr:hypothetical protein NP233_g3166 [Leucocoprinus birnbaumii]
MGNNEPPEEPLLASLTDGFGYFTTAAVNRSLGQYQFVRKLGWAASSSVWLALDKSMETRSFVALKLLTSQATAQLALSSSPNHTEYHVFRKIKDTNPNSLGFNHCLTLKRWFTAQSEAGNHICFVTEPLSSSLHTIQQHEYNRFPLPVAKRITKQVLLALDYLHRECGYIHTDIKADNVVASIPQPVDSRIEKFVLTYDPIVYGPPLELKSSSLPVFFSRSEPLPYFKLGGTLEDISVRLIDYGQAISVDEPLREDSCQPVNVRAPEVILKYPWTSAIDIWSVGCLLFQLLTEHHLFGQEGEHTRELHLQNIEECVGRFPSQFLRECEKRGQYFDDKGSLLHTNNDYKPTPISDFLKQLSLLDEDEVMGATNFILRCLTLDPKLRPTAQELLEDDWLL